MNKNFMLSMIMLFFLTACQSTLMEPVSEQAITNAKPGTSQIIFMRSSFIGGAIQSSVFDVTSGKPVLVGIVSNNTKISFDATPGEHMFMVVGESADFLKATVLENKTYYAVITPRMGFWTSRFSLHPVRNDASGKFQYGTKDFQKLVKDTKLVANGDKARQWAEKNSNDIFGKLNKYLPVWNSKEVAKRNEATIEVVDHH